MTTLPKGFVPFHNIDGAKAVVIPSDDGKRVSVVWAHAGPLADKITKTGEDVVLGPRHVVSLAAWAGTKVQETKEEKVAAVNTAKDKAAKTPAKKAAPKAGAKISPSASPESGSPSGVSRGRPRKDGLATGSYEVGILTHAHETRTAVPQEVLDKMSPEARLVEEARNEKILNGGGIKRGRPPKAAGAAKITNIADAKKAKEDKDEADGETPEAPRRRLIRRAATK
jgi:hypothetical protein